MLFDLAHAINDQPVIRRVRAAMHGQAQHLRRILAPRQQNAVATEVMQADGMRPQRVKKQAKARQAANLPWQEVVTLHPRMIVRVSFCIDRAEWQGQAVASLPADVLFLSPD